MLDPYKCTIKEATEYAQELKRSFGDVGENQSVTLEYSVQQFLIVLLFLAHPSGARIDFTAAEITIARKPANCDRYGTSQTCYHIKPHAGAQYHPVWFADCRKMIRSQRLRGLELVAA